jgi:hypothetical protein
MQQRKQAAPSYQRIRLSNQTLWIEQPDYQMDMDYHEQSTFNR